MKIFLKNPARILLLTIALIDVHQLRAQSSSASTNLNGSLPSAPNQFLGSSNIADVIFKSHNSERMRILSTGNIGIGTATPTAKLHIDSGILKLTGPNSSGGPMVVFGGTSSIAPNGEWAVEYTTATAGKEGVNFWKPFGASGT